ncbi:MAG: hypothetical protein POELPBGB_01550 [Bacteroidia bacterium]|nr:hypothetical protein [Bacteroidia bacterium]
MKRLSPPELIIFFALSTLFNPAHAKKSDYKIVNPQSVFIENKGQWPEQVLFLTRLNGLDAWITREGIVYDFYRTQSNSPGYEKLETFISERSGHIVKVFMQNASLPSAKGEKKINTYYNYIIGNNPSAWASNVGLYHEVCLKNIYDGIDQRYYFEGDNIRYDYIIQPGAELNQIKFTVDGSEKVFVNEMNELVFTTRFGEVKQAGLFAYQQVNGEKQQVNCSFIQEGKTITFESADYNKTLPLIIDPLVYSTYIGGTGEESLLYSLDVDGAGNVYVTGRTSSADYPTTTGAYDEINNGGPHDVYITKLNAAGSALVYSTFVGGSGMDWGYSLKTDGNGNVYVTGDTYSSDFPTTSGVISETLNGLGDAYVLKLNAAGNALDFSTFIGGSGVESGKSLALDANGNTYITGTTQSYDFPVTSGAYDETVNGSGNTPYDAFVVKINATATGFLYSTYLGGTSSNGENGIAITIDADGNAYVAGTTHSSDFPVTSGAYDESFNSLNNTYDIFIAKLNAAGNALVYSTFIGTATSENVNAITIDANGNAYITGGAPINFPTTSGAYDQTFGGGGDAFVTKLNAAGTALVFSTYLGGAFYENSKDIKLDAAGNIIITGTTASAAFPTVAGAYDQTYNDNGSYGDVFLSVFNSSGSSLLYSTFIGGSNKEFGGSLFADANGNVYLTGETVSSDFPVTSGCFDETYNAGTDDLFILKINLSDITGIYPVDANKLFSVFPNPANSEINFAVNNSGLYSLVLFDMQGKSIYSRDVVIGTNYSMNIQDIKAGFYLLKLTDNFGETEIVRIIIN